MVESSGVICGTISLLMENNVQQPKYFVVDVNKMRLSFFGKEVTVLFSAISMNRVNE